MTDEAVECSRVTADCDGLDVAMTHSGNLTIYGRVLATSTL